MNESPPITQSSLVLERALAIAQPLATWLVRAGLGHREFSEALKTVFLQAAQAELERTDGRQTDSALSLLSGLHRKDVRALLPGVLIPLGFSASEVGRPTLANQLVTRWLAEHDGVPLPFSTATAVAAATEDLDAAGVSLLMSFEMLAASVSRDVRPRALLDELLRLGVVREMGNQVELVQQAFIADRGREEAAKMVAGSVADHLNAAVHNLTRPTPKTYLEQSVFADGLRSESIHELEMLANSLWSHVLSTTVKAAQPLADKDEALGGQNRIRIGMYCFSEPVMAQTPATTNPADEPPQDTSPT